MILQFKTFGTVSSIFLHLSQYLSKEEKQCYADDYKKHSCYTPLCQLEGAGQQTISGILFPHPAWTYFLDNVCRGKMGTLKVKGVKHKFPFHVNVSRNGVPRSTSQSVLLQRNALKAPATGPPKIIIHDLQDACCSFSSVSYKSDHHTARTNKGFCWSHLTSCVYDQSVIINTDLHTGVKKCFSF